MKKKRITYGVTGMMEYQAVIKIGRSQMKVLFTDGSATGYGTNPAMYTTDNFMVQKAIENSEQFKRGRIHIVESFDLDEEVNVIGSVKKELIPTPTPSLENPSTGEETAIEDTPASTQMEMPEEITEMEFDNNDDARDFLETKFGYVRSKLRNRADIVAAGVAHNIAISFS